MDKTEHDARGRWERQERRCLGQRGGEGEGAPFQVTGSGCLISQPPAPPGLMGVGGADVTARGEATATSPARLLARTVSASCAGSGRLPASQRASEGVRTRGQLEVVLLVHFWGTQPPQKYSRRSVTRQSLKQRAGDVGPGQGESADTYPGSGPPPGAGRRRLLCSHRLKGPGRGPGFHTLLCPRSIRKAASVLSATSQTPPPATRTSARHSQPGAPQHPPGVPFAPYGLESFRKPESGPGAGPHPLVAAVQCLPCSQPSPFPRLPLPSAHTGFPELVGQRFVPRPKPFGGICWPLAARARPLVPEPAGLPASQPPAARSPWLARVWGANPQGPPPGGSRVSALFPRVPSRAAPLCPPA